jgi:2-polyprenyl-3-methyl-5-hydroxy-6-metoxy-1,4-benzoquinol methylase
MIEGYKENPELPENMISKHVERFEKHGLVMPEEQRTIYQEITKMITGLVVADIGCGTGIGTNILSQEARFVWGVDKDPKAIDFAKQMFERKPSCGLGQVSFEVLDLVNPPTREHGKFHVITCVDVLEHIEDYQTALNTIKRFYESGKTTLFISTPNNSNEKFPKDHPLNPHHVRQWTCAEFYDIMIKNFQYVNLMSWNMKDLLDLNTTITPLVCKAEGNLL